MNGAGPISAPWYQRFVQGVSAAPGADVQPGNTAYNAGRILGEWTADPYRRLMSAMNMVQADPTTEEGQALRRAAYEDVPGAIAQIGMMGSVVPGRPAGSLGSTLGKKVFRYSKTAERPSNKVPYTFWADSPDGLQEVYGPHGWEADTKNMVHIKDIADEIYNKMLEHEKEDLLPAGVTMEYVNELNPQNIVEHAGAWDDSQFITWFADNFGDKYPAIKTDNGAIVLGDEFLSGLKKYNKE